MIIRMATSMVKSPWTSLNSKNNYWMKMIKSTIKKYIIFLKLGKTLSATLSMRNNRNKKWKLMDWWEITINRMRAQYVHKSTVQTLSQASISKIRIKAKMAAIYKTGGIMMTRRHYNHKANKKFIIHLTEILYLHLYRLRDNLMNRKTKWALQNLR